MKTYGAILTVCILAMAARPASAVCEYNGVMSAKTTIAQEFKDSPWVVRAHVVSADYHWSDEGDAWVFYRLRVVETFKGKMPPRFTFFTTRDSGGFYMDSDGPVPDFDQDYLLFLVPDPYGVYRKTHRKDHTYPRRAIGAFWVNYNCGQSKGWSGVTAAEQQELARLSSSRRSRTAAAKSPALLHLPVPEALARGWGGGPHD